ncbi:MAG: hypothetical protein L0Y44_12095 [Phycisphaerales bacterium]|nr:hypothetical protein [Phycisphaerales bacterium]MCI0631381.1 hypothetical protein [Phycisphaerales bacterium]MCI0675333.1 hypothetical protein [Phycisphaerales bacterium]
MLKFNACRIVAGAGMALGLCSAMQAQTVVEVREAYIERPPGAVVIVEPATTAADTIELFRDRDLEGDTVLINVIGTQAAGTAHDLPDGIKDSLSSLRWSLPPGVLVVLYEDHGAKGEQLALWGSGQIDALSAFDLNDKASEWAWFYVGGAVEPTEFVRYGEVIPVGASAGTAPVPQGTLQLFKSKNFEATTFTVNSVTSNAANTLHELTGALSDSLTAMRWSLPPGVVVILYQDADGDKQQVPIWGNGQVANLDVWDFNDKASRWAWYYIGSRHEQVLGYVPPAEPYVAPADVFAEVIPEVIQEPIMEVGEVEVVEVKKEPIDLVAGAMVSTELEIEAADLRAKENPVGAGTFVFVEQTEFGGIERYVIWLVLDAKAYALTGPAKMTTPTLPLPTDASESVWAPAGINQLHAEEDSAKIVFHHAAKPSLKKGIDD